jgi:hypothetical protein
LLQSAFEIASEIPEVPHQKDRAKMQAAAVQAALQLDRPDLARTYVEQIGDWRRGAGYADYAFYLARQGQTNEVQRYLDLAEAIARTADQDWRRDRINVRIAQTHAVLGHTALATSFSTDLEASETGKMEQTQAELCASGDFDRCLSDLDPLLSTADFDQTKNALYALAELFNRFYAETKLRNTAEQKLRSAWGALPLFVRMELLETLADFALQNQDVSKARELADEARELLVSAQWPTEYRVPASARLAALRFRCGEPGVARTELAAALEWFDQHPAEIIDIYKADTLLPVAEAFQTVGDPNGARAVYLRALAVAVENPNSRPRAEDLCAVCLSMAAHGVEPDEALQARIREIRDGLGDPW